VGKGLLVLTQRCYLDRVGRRRPSPCRNHHWRSLQKMINKTVLHRNPAKEMPA
jgi:hypothetical protein